MRATLLVGAFAALALAAPRPQDIEFDQVDAAPDPVVVDTNSAPSSVSLQPSAAAATLGAAQVTDVATANKKRFVNLIGKRDGDCSPEPAGSGPAVSTPDDSPTSFQAWQDFITLSKNAALPANVPAGWNLAFSNLQASSQITSYLGYKTLTSYDVNACASYCNEQSDCIAFNIYFERDPSIKPNAVSCPNPTSVTNIKCVRWGVQVAASTAVNTGEHRDSFQVVISGSNGYNKIQGPPSAPGFNGPIALPGAINAPNDPVTNTNTYMGYKFFAFDPTNGVQSFQNGVASCLAACTAQTAYNSRHPPAAPAKPDVCNQIVVYILNDVNTPQGIYCSMYNENWAAEYATNLGQYRGSDYWSVTQAYTYTNATYAANYPQAICDIAGCPSGSYTGGNCGGWGVGTCGSS